MARIAAGVIRWAVGAVLLWLGKAITVLVSPIVSLPVFVVHVEESVLTGFPSLHPGKPREFLVKPLRWMQTHDAPLDEWRYEAYSEGSRWRENKYMARVFWLCRNPAYGLAEMLGFDQYGIQEVRREVTAEWRTPNTGYELIEVQNGLGQRAWEKRGQVKLFRSLYMEYRTGYGVFRESPIRGRGMLYARLFKFRRYHE